MRIWASSTVLLLIDSIAIAIGQGYMLVRGRLPDHDVTSKLPIRLRR